MFDRQKRGQGTRLIARALALSFYYETQSCRRLLSCENLLLNEQARPRTDVETQETQTSPFGPEF